MEPRVLLCPLKKILETMVFPDKEMFIYFGKICFLFGRNGINLVWKPGTMETCATRQLMFFFHFHLRIGSTLRRSKRYFWFFYEFFFSRSSTQVVFFEWVQQVNFGLFSRSHSPTLSLGPPVVFYPSPLYQCDPNKSTKNNVLKCMQMIPIIFLGLLLISQLLIFEYLRVQKCNIIVF